MAQYFLHTEGALRQSDGEGTEMSNHGSVRKHAIVYAGQVMHGEPNVLWDGNDFNVQVTDEAGLLLFTLIAYVANAPAAGDTK